MPPWPRSCRATRSCTISSSNCPAIRPGHDSPFHPYNRSETMKLSKTLGAVALAFGLTTAFGAAQAADLKIGLVVPMSGPFAAHGKQITHGIDLFLAEHGDTV